MDSSGPSSWRPLPRPGEPSPEMAGEAGRDRGIRHVRRLSSWTAAAMIAATAITAGYFAQAGVGATRPAAVSGTHSQAPNSRQPCVTAPVATSGGSGVTTTVPASSCAPGPAGGRPAVVYVQPAEGRGD